MNMQYQRFFSFDRECNFLGLLLSLGNGFGTISSNGPFIKFASYFFLLPRMILLTLYFYPFYYSGRMGGGRRMPSGGLCCPRSSDWDQPCALSFSFTWLTKSYPNLKAKLTNGRNITAGRIQVFGLFEVFICKSFAYNICIQNTFS